MKKITLFLLFIVLAASQVNAQTLTESDEPVKKPKKDFNIMDKLIIGGSLGGTFGTYTYVDISPTVGYLLTDNFLVGIGAKYNYIKDGTYKFTYRFSSYAGSIFTQYYFLESFIAHAEYELMNTAFAPDILRPELERINIHSVFVGGGYRGSIGGNSFISLLVLFNLNETIYSPYSNPQIRAGIGIGF